MTRRRFPRWRRGPAVLVVMAAIVAWPRPSALPPVEAAAATAESSDELVSMDFRQTEIGDVLRLLAKQYDLNIIIADDIKGPVSVQFSNVGIDEALDAIITVNGYAYSRRGHVIKVTSAAAAEREQPTTQVFALNNANVATLKESLKAVLTSTGTMEADARSNTLVVTDTPNVITTITRVVQELDVPTPQVAIEAQIIETALNKNEKLGIDWNVQVAAQGASRPIIAPFTQKPEKLGPFDLQGLPQFLPSGLTANSTTTTVTTGGQTSATSVDFPAASAFPFVAKDAFKFGTLSFNQFQIVMQALQVRSNTKILANPRITTLDNQQAKITVGTVVPIPTFERNNTTGDFQITGYQDKSVGIVLTVTPHVSKDGHVRLELHPEVSSISSFVGDPRAQVPVTTTRDATTQVSLRDGDTVVIGGLINDKVVKIHHSVPLLGDLPLLGRMFQFNDETHEKTDLLIFITAHILTDDKARALTQVAVQESGRPAAFSEAVLPQRQKRLKLQPRGKQAL